MTSSTSNTAASSAPTRTPPQVSLTAVTSPNTRFDRFSKNGTITLPSTPIFTQDDRFFTIGSCFAEEIRLALTKGGIKCLPAYRTVVFDPSTAVVDELPQREHMNFYNTFTVRLQIEQLLGLWHQTADDHWAITRGLSSLVPWDEPHAYQDPYRRLIIAKTPEALNEVIASVNASMRTGFDNSTAFVLTYGMTEVFINKHSGKAVAQKPAYGGGGGVDETVFHRSTYEENLDNVLATIDLIQSHRPGAKVVMSVSPVPLARTFADEDIVTANMESKSLLRAVLGAASRARSDVYYLPSYEYVCMLGLDGGFMHDWRHVQRAVVGNIVQAFVDAFFMKNRIPPSLVQSSGV